MRSVGRSPRVRGGRGGHQPGVHGPGGRQGTRVLRCDRPADLCVRDHLKAAGQVVQDPQLGLDYSRVVHGDQKFAYTRPVRAGDRLTVTSTIEAIKSMAGNDIVDIRGEVHDEAGKHVVTAVTKLVARAAEEG